MREISIFVERKIEMQKWMKCFGYLNITPLKYLNLISENLRRLVIKTPDKDVI
jgi:hypothetical protein